uniref:Uncharacterized protein n=1 Tax=Amazona collaria TaxID=241587 RepID=A0A8B9FJM4_9PSIT
HKLQRLDNRLRVLPPMLLRSLPHLEKLLLDNNLIQVLPPQGFFGLNKLKLLTLGSNCITELPCCLFDTMADLRELDLAKNSLAMLPDSIFVLHQNAGDSGPGHLETSLDFIAEAVGLLPPSPPHPWQVPAGCKWSLGKDIPRL